MLEITTPAVEAELNLNFAEVYAHSALYQWVDILFSLDNKEIK